MITQEEVNRLFFYDKETGIVTRKISVGGNTMIGDFVGSIPNKRKRYLRTRINGRDYYLHRIIWLYVNGSFPEYSIDHINGDGLDNRISNLRVVTAQENSRNQKLFRTSKTGFCGVYKTKSNKFYATIRMKGKTSWLGVYTTLMEAVDARLKANIANNFHENHGRHVTL